MEFTVFTSAGGFREFVGDSTYEVGEGNGCLYCVDGKTGQVVTYGANAWASCQEWQREGELVPPEGESRRPRSKATKAVVPAPEIEPEIELEIELDLEPEPVVAAPLYVPTFTPSHAAPVEDRGVPAPRSFDPLSDPLETFAE